MKKYFFSLLTILLTSCASQSFEMTYFSIEQFAHEINTQEKIVKTPASLGSVNVNPLYAKRDIVEYKEDGSIHYIGNPRWISSPEILFNRVLTELLENTNNTDSAKNPTIDLNIKEFAISLKPSAKIYFAYEMSADGKIIGENTIAKQVEPQDLSSVIKLLAELVREEFKAALKNIQ